MNVIPAYPLKSFRQTRSIYSSCLYDIGCYPISLLVDLKIKVKKIKIIKFKFSKKILQNILLKIYSNNCEVEINLGLSNKYQNFVQIHMIMKYLKMKKILCIKKI